MPESQFMTLAAMREAYQLRKAAGLDRKFERVRREAWPKADPEQMARVKVGLAADKARNAAIAAQLRQESAARLASATAPAPKTEAVPEDDFVAVRKARIAEQKKQGLNFARRDLQERFASHSQVASTFEARVTQREASKSAPSPSPSEKRQPSATSTAPTAPNLSGDARPVTLPSRLASRLAVEAAQKRARRRLGAQKLQPTASTLHKISKGPARNLRTPFETHRQKEANHKRSWAKYSRQAAIEERDRLRKDHDDIIELLRTIGRRLDTLPRDDPERERIQESGDDLRDILKEIDQERLPAALRRLEKYGGESEEDVARERAEKEARMADIRAGNEIVARQRAIDTAPYSARTTYGILDARNPWPSRPNYRPGKTRL
ncbi:hypothetical protein FKW77_008570 [Venturia effusa]|uniref:Uncharacterized protein n=1 Tax=Venturia effusa TaxID=50376 RepID=A0A517LJD3_9PEZI|nr:hypothetical protein FKW77_008570 [Venturia effusa]